MIFVDISPEDKNTVILKQFLNFGNSIIPKDADFMMWPIPIKYMTANGINMVLLDKEKIEVKFDKFIKLNVGQHGFYRVEYSDEISNKLLENMGKFDDIDKYGIIFDICKNTDKNGLTKFIKIIERLKGEFSFIVWHLLNVNIYLIYSNLNIEYRCKFSEILNLLFTSSFENVGKFESKKPTDIECVTQRFIAETLGILAENKTVRDEALKKYQEFLKNKDMKISSEVFPTIERLAFYSIFSYLKHILY